MGVRLFPLARAGRCGNLTFRLFPDASAPQSVGPSLGRQRTEPVAAPFFWSNRVNGGCMAKAVLIRHAQSGLTRNGYVGFSWTYLFFGWFVPLFRGELGTAALHLLFSIFTLGLWQLIFCFIYNRQYMTRMLTGGWELADSDAKNQLAAARLGIVRQPKITASA